MSDDGWGPIVVDAFQAEYAVGTSVEVADLGTPGLDLSPWLADVSGVIIADTVRANLAPGTVCVYHKDDLLRHPPGVRTGPHEPGLKAALLALDFAGRGPRDVCLVGVVPARIAPGLDLSDGVKNAIQPAVALIAAVLRRWRLPVMERAAAPVRSVSGWRPRPCADGNPAAGAKLLGIPAKSAWHRGCAPSPSRRRRI